jgi:DNA-binding TFAR19-related protein (PDSD5 family)
MEALQAARMQQMGSAGGGAPDQEEMQRQQEAREAAEAQRQAMLTRLLMPSAKERCESPNPQHLELTTFAMLPSCL